VQKRGLPFLEAKSKVIKKPLSLQEMKDWRTREPTREGRRALGTCVAPLDFAILVSVRGSHGTTTVSASRSLAWMAISSCSNSAAFVAVLVCSGPLSGSENTDGRSVSFRLGRPGNVGTEIWEIWGNLGKSGDEIWGQKSGDRRNVPHFRCGILLRCDEVISAVRLFSRVFATVSLGIKD
jgi:hypothetical protein